ncbi:MAG: protein translocase SEC61 complex subunit gamma [Euryarchaeota archaeon HGW-Euryarchaeota-1]|nr:MAG: protein translocase SEC61 complex subunit gamma [Euryarchaeota archaeon HGW-Euryarchaeota-1]
MVTTQAIKNYLERCYRILLILKKPSNDELKQSLLITLVGFLLIGVVAWLIWVVAKVIFP